ncbi:myosin light chain kinase, smooth muscle-like [Antedon mediterranea]|uniref:myosin light chain kinase, smooth muscle-like n=1 Tax=Antedon mediterranea TaxID=105859 RepID=UPI003AF62E01
MDEDGYRANYIEVKLCEVDKYYDIFEEIGKGRFGVVHRCVEKATGKTWAAKCVRALRRKDRDEIKREVELMSILEHPMLLQCGGAFEGRSSMTIILEHVSGGELFERIISDDFEFCESDAVIFMRQICLGVQHMHKLNIVHLDLKPENIMCMDKRSNRIKIIDFGLSRKLKPGEAMKVMFGTPEFIAPEVINYDPIETLTDMWSVGVICYILLSGFSPFLGDLDTDTLNNVTRAEWDFDDPAFDTISEDAKAFIEALLIRLPRKRNCAEECLRHGWLAGDTRPKETTRLSTEKLKRYVAKRRWQKTAIALRAIHRMNVLTMFGGKSESNSAGKSTTLEKPDELSSTEEQKPSTKRVSRLRRRNSIVDEVRQKFEPNNNDPSIGIDVFKETMFTKDKTRTIMAEKTQTFTKYQMPSAILDTLKDQCVCKGDTVKFICKINGNPRPEVCWFKNGDVIDENNHFKFEFDDICRYSLIINHVTEDDFGRYSIKASNTLGECESSANLCKKESTYELIVEITFAC